MYFTNLPICLSMLVVTSIHALNFQHPRATDIAADKYDLIGFSPMPTTAPSPQDLKARANRIFQPRQNPTTNTCGYLEGDESEPYTCGFGSACIWNTAYDYFGCCSVDAGGDPIVTDCPGVANPYTSCYPYSEATNCVGACFTENRVCDATLPYCAAGYLFDGATTFTQYFCNSVSEGATLNFLPTFTTEASAAASVSSTTIGSVDAGLKSVITVTAIQTQIQTQSPCSTCTASDITPGPVPVHHSHAGAIAGGVIGGLILLGALVGGTIFFMYRRKIKQRQQIHMEVSQNTN